MGLFGPSKKEVWTQLCRETQSKLVDKGFWKGSKVEHKHRAWLLVLDEYTVSTGKSSVTYTRIRVPYVPKQPFTFQISRSGLFSGMAKLLGAQDIETGDAVFDEAYVVKSDDDWQVRRLLDNEELRALLLLQKYFNLHNRQPMAIFRESLPVGAEQMEFQITGVIRKVEVLKDLFSILCMVLDGLCAMDAITNAGVDMDY